MPPVCTNCGASSTTTRSKFCSECGQRFIPTTTATTTTFDSSSSFSSSLPNDIAPLGASAFRTPSSALGSHAYQHTPASTSHNHTLPLVAPPLSFATVDASPLPSNGKSLSPSSALRNSSKPSGNVRNTVRFASTSSSSTESFAPCDVVPPAATGADALQLYEQCVQTIRAAKGGLNDRGVKEFKHNCRQFGLKEITVERFYASIVAELGPQGTSAFVPTLARLVPDDERRKELVEFNAVQQRQGLDESRSSSFTTKSNSRSSSFRDRSSSAGQRPSQTLVQRNSSMTESDAGVLTKKGLLNNRYADHPNCDVCSVHFDVTKRRHQCRLCGQYICSACSPVRLLVPPGREIEGAKKYDASIPQRVCIQCAPQLHPLQDELVAMYAQSQTDNAHEARSRLHIPFTNSLNKECCNAADVIGNFFRNEWGSSADRAIPVAFLQKAHGLAVMTVVKAGFLVSGTIGTGLVVAKLPDGSWSAPSAIGTFGLSGGFEIGGELIEVMIILGSEGAVKVFHKPQVSLGAGLDLAVGPFGRSAQAAAAASSSGLNANYSYSHSKGLYAGISLQGAIVAARTDMNRKFYGRDLQPSELLSGYVEQPAAARPLYEAIDNAMRGIANHKEEQQRRSEVMGACRLCNCPMYQAHTTQVWNKKCKSCKHAH